MSELFEEDKEMVKRMVGSPSWLRIREHLRSECITIPVGSMEQAALYGARAQGFNDCFKAIERIATKEKNNLR